MGERAVAGSRVGIIGGSIAGCATAIALERLGCEVTILERSGSGLKDRGSGIAVPVALRNELIETGYLPPDYAVWSGVGRRWYVADGSEAGDLRWEQPGMVVTNNWGELWRGLRSNVGGDVDYVDGAEVRSIDDRGDDVVVDLADGSRRTFDVVFGADGYRSAVPTLLRPASRPRFAGYVLWRGNFAADRLSDRRAWDDVITSQQWVTVAFDGGHGVMYPIPDFAESGGGMRVNWAVYAPRPAGLVIDGPSSIPPGAVDEHCHRQLEELLARVMPRRLLPLFSSPREEVSIQPIYDEFVDHYTAGNVALIGDAATLSRPHTGSGATKAMQDARLLEVLGGAHSTWPSLLAAYDRDRSAEGRRLVELGRRIGRDQVEQTPSWSTMAPADFEAWAANTLDGDALYFWGDGDDESAPAGGGSD